VIDMTQEAKPSHFRLSVPGGSDLLERYALLSFLVVMVAFAAITSPAFLQPTNLLNILTIAAPLGMVVLGQTFALLVRGLDLSVASLMATVAVLATAFRASSNDMIPVIFVAAILFSAFVGLVNGWLIARRGVSPFLATLATMIILQGARFAYTGGAPISTLPPGMGTLATGQFLGLPINLWTLAVMAIALGALLRMSRFGREIYMVGGNPKAARLVGISPDRVIIASYAICSICAGIGGLFLLGYVGTVSNWVGQGYELDSIVAGVMGGVALSGGRGGVGGALLGVAVLIVVGNLVILLGLPVDIQLIIKGVIIIGAAAFYRTKLI
jgi:ribose transport system permease protein/inositol transport system permease protein